MQKRKDRAVKAACTLILVVAFLLPVDVHQVSASLGTELYTHVAYLFFHANWFHLLANLYVFWFMRFTLRQLGIAVLLSVPASFCTLTPCVGFSGVLYALIGMVMCSHRVPRKAWILFLVVNGVTAFIPSIAFGVHAASFLLAYGYVCVRRRIDGRHRETDRRR